MPTKRIRIFAGPNGSGKSTIYKNLVAQGGINFGVFVNADEIEHQLKTELYLDFSYYQLRLDLAVLIESYQRSAFYALSNGAAFVGTISQQENKLVISDKSLINSYIAAFLTDYLRINMLDCVDVFTIETVLSHPSKIEFINLAKSKGYRVYLYFVSTRSAEINIARVQYRTQTGGHPVPTEKIIARYDKSLSNLFHSLISSHRAYVFDNSDDDKPIWHVEFDGSNIQLKSQMVPLWILDYLIKKLV